MLDGNIVVEITIKRGSKSKYRGKHTITQAVVTELGEAFSKESAMEYFSKCWDETYGRSHKPHLSVVKGTNDG
jgi:hypothetical protein